MVSQHGSPVLIVLGRAYPEAARKMGAFGVLPAVAHLKGLRATGYSKTHASRSPYSEAALSTRYACER